MTFELKPTISQASFYGKAIVTAYSGYQTLRSYNTVVAAINQEGEFIRLWTGYSATTMRHINAFRTLHNLDPISKSEWQRLDIGQSSELYYRIQEFNANAK